MGKYSQDRNDGSALGKTRRVKIGRFVERRFRREENFPGQRLKDSRHCPTLASKNPLTLYNYDA